VDKAILDLYSDYLVSSFGATTATGLSALLDGEISHDQITRSLAKKKAGSKEIWQIAKPYVRQVEDKSGLLIIDDSIEEKPYTDENEHICWHYDHSKERQVKGINFISLLYHSQGVSLPIGFVLVTKTEIYKDEKTGKIKRRSTTTKNEHYRQMLKQAVQNQVKFKYVLNDIWYAAVENMNFIKQELKKQFIMPLKSNRKVALSQDDKRKGKYVCVEAVDIKSECTKTIYLEGIAFPLLLAKQIFTNEDGSTGILYLVTSDTSLTYERITTIYQTRWKVEEYHKSLKQNVSLSKSPTQTINTQTNHFFAALWGYIKLEVLKLQSKQNHFALKSKLYIQALKQAFAAWQSLKPSQTSA
jgi:DDE superfamily endonuclease